MRLSYLAYTFSLVIMYFSLVLLTPAVVALIYNENNAIMPFVIAALISFVVAGILRLIVGDSKDIKSINDIKKSEGLFIVTFSWIFAGMLTAIPYLYFGFSPINAFFEATSGITATGATIFTNYNYPNALFFWRSLSQWIGGMGIIVLFVAILPQFAIAGRQLFFAEAPGPTEEKITPRIKNTAASLWAVYFGMTIIEIILLKFSGMSTFHAVCHSFSSVSGGGFSPNEFGIIGSSSTIVWIICFFSFFAGASYNLQQKAISKFNPLVLFKNEEFRVYFTIFAILGTAISVSLCINSNYAVLESIKHSFFQVSSIVSSTGFCSDDFTKWDYTSKAILMFGFFTGGCASSAGGGIKVVRWLLILKIMKSELAKILHSKAVFNIKFGTSTVSKDVLYQTLMFVFFFIIISMFSAFIISVTENNTMVGLAGTISAMGNIGPAIITKIGPILGYDSLQPLSKIILIFDMYVGRLELVPFLVLFQKSFWSFK